MIYRMIPRLALTCSLAGLFLLVTNPFAVRADNPPVIRLDPPSQSVDVGNGPFTVSVMVDNVADLGAYEFQLQFDPAVVRFVGVEDGGFLGSTGRQLQCPTATLFYPADGDLPNEIRDGCSTLNSTPAGPSGSGRLAVVTFAPIGSGYSDLTFTAVGPHMDVTGISGDSLSPTTQNGAVTITGDGPAATPAPDEPTSVPTAKYVAPVTVTPNPGANSMLTPEPGETPLSRPMPGSAINNPPSGGLQAASDPAGIARAASGTASGSSQGSPHAGTGPEQQKSSWPALAGGLLVAVGGGLLFMSFFLKRVPAQRNDHSKE
jgi:hypothetical protein